MKVIKRKGKKTYINKKGNACHYMNYFLENDNGKRIQIKCAFERDYAALDVIAYYEA